MKSLHSKRLVGLVSGTLPPLATISATTPEAVLENKEGISSVSQRSAYSKNEKSNQEVKIIEP